MAEQVKKTGRGGKRKGAGRKKGQLDKRTLDAMAVKREYQNKIRKHADRLFNAQMALAEGVTLLFKVKRDKKGKESKPELVKSESEIAQFIEECGGYDGVMNGNTYYFLTTKIPDSRTISDMLDRAMGKPDATLDVTSKGQSVNPYAQLSVEELRKLASK